MNKPAAVADRPARPQDFARLRAGLAQLASDFTLMITELWPRLEDRKFRWELHRQRRIAGYEEAVECRCFAR